MPQSFAVGDFNGDGNLDLAVVNVDIGVSVFLGNGAAVSKWRGAEPIIFSRPY